MRAGLVLEERWPYSLAIWSRFSAKLEHTKVGPDAESMVMTGRVGISTSSALGNLFRGLNLRLGRLDARGLGLLKWKVLLLRNMWCGSLLVFVRKEFHPCTVILLACMILRGCILHVL